MPSLDEPFSAEILDFNLKRMSPEQLAGHGIPAELGEYVGDYRQYPPRIALALPEGVRWYREGNPWFYKDALNVSHPHDDCLILSGSGMSAHRYQEGALETDPENIALLEVAQQRIRDYLGVGKWVLGICFGGQLAMHSVGGRVGRLPGNTTEAGWLPHTLTQDGHQDEVFSALPHVFYAPHFHNDFVLALPSPGTDIHSEMGSTRVKRARVLATRQGFLGRLGIEQRQTQFIHASVVICENGARLYQVQFHPEMASLSKTNYLVLANPWLGDPKEMGEDYYLKAQSVPRDAQFTANSIITRFAELARDHQERSREMQYSRSWEPPDFGRYMI